MKKAVVQLETLACPACVLKIESAIKSLDGVEKDSVDVLFNASKAKFSFDEETLSLQQVEKAINDMGYEVLKSQEK